MEGNLPKGPGWRQTKTSSWIQESGNFQVKLSEGPGWNLSGTNIIGKIVKFKQDPKIR